MKVLAKNIAVFMIVIIFFFGCAANKPQTEPETGKEQPAEEIDNLFGISEEQKSSEQKSDENEVLRLLGITKEEGGQSEAAEPTAKKDEEKLKSEIEDLEQQLSNKESEIDNLKSEIALKDERISELESNIGTNLQPERYSGAVATDFQADYQNALSEYHNRNYKQAINMFESLLMRSSTNSLSDNCQYWIGECYYGLSKYNQAIVEFTKVFSFNNSNKVDDAQLKLGLCYWKLGDREKAREEFERLISDYPKSEYIEKAEYFLSQL